MRLVAAAVLPWAALLTLRVPLLGEVVGITLPVLGVVAVLLGLRARRHPTRAVALASLGLACVVGTIAPWTPAAAPAPLRPVTVTSANLLGENPGEEAARDLVAALPDVLVTVETPAAALEVLREAYPHRLASLPRPLGGVNVWSVHPLRRLPALDGTRQARTVLARVDAPEPFTLLAAHLPRPWVRSRGLVGLRGARGYQADLLTHHRITVAVAEGVASLAGPVVVAGDLNLTDRGWGYRLLTGTLDDAMRSTWALPTSTKSVFLPLRLRIDHILVGGWCGRSAGLVPIEGSDHRAVRAEVGPCPTGPD